PVVDLQLVELVWRDPDGVVALAPDQVLGLAYLVQGDELALTGQRELEGAVLLDQGDDRLAGHVAAADQDVRVVVASGVEELPPAGLGSMQVRGEEDPRHTSLLLTDILVVYRVA